MWGWTLLRSAILRVRCVLLAKSLTNCIQVLFRIIRSLNVRTSVAGVVLSTAGDSVAQPAHGGGDCQDVARAPAVAGPYGVGGSRAGCVLPGRVGGRGGHAQSVLHGACAYVRLLLHCALPVRTHGSTFVSRVLSMRAPHMDNSSVAVVVVSTCNDTYTG